MKTVAICAARMGSTRFPGKVLMPLVEKTVMDWVIYAAYEAQNVDAVWVATTTEPRDDAIVKACDGRVNFWRGSETNVLSRYADCAREAEADIVVRLTCDCPLLDSRIIDEVIELRRLTGADYASNVDPPTYPDGLDVQVVTAEALYIAEKEARSATDRDTVLDFIARDRTRFKHANLICPLPGLGSERWVLDTEEDYKFCQAIIEKLDYFPSMIEVLRILRDHPTLREINKMWDRNERFFEQVAAQ